MLKKMENIEKLNVEVLSSSEIEVINGGARNLTQELLYGVSAVVGFLANLIDDPIPGERRNNHY